MRLSGRKTGAAHSALHSRPLYTAIYMCDRSLLLQIPLDIAIILSHVKYFTNVTQYFTLIAKSCIVIIQKKIRIVALMKGTGFTEIGSTMGSRFKRPDGVPGIRELPVVTLFET